MFIESELGKLQFMPNYVPARTMAARMARIRKSSNVGARSALNGLFDTLLTTATSAAAYRMQSLQRSRAEADERLRQAKLAEEQRIADQAAMQRAAAAAAVAPVAQPARKALPIIPLAIGGAALAGAAFFMLKKKR